MYIIANRATREQAGISGVSFWLPVTGPLSDRLAVAAMAGTIAPPLISRISLHGVPPFPDTRGHADGKIVIAI